MRPVYNSNQLSARLEATMITLRVSLSFYVEAMQTGNLSSGARSLLAIIECSKYLQGTVTDWLENHDVPTGLHDAAQLGACQAVKASIDGAEKLLLKQRQRPKR